MCSSTTVVIFDDTETRLASSCRIENNFVNHNILFLINQFKKPSI